MVEPNIALVLHYERFLATRNFGSRTMYYVQEGTLKLTSEKSKASELNFTWNVQTSAMEIRSTNRKLYLTGGTMPPLTEAKKWGLRWVEALEPVAPGSRADSWTVFSYNTPTTLELPVSPCQSIGKALGGSIEGCALGPWFNGSCRVVQLGPSGIGLPFLDVAY